MNDEVYEIADEDGELFEVRAVNMLEENPTLEARLLENGYDGYAYVLANVDPLKSYQVFNCFKVVSGDFEKMPQLNKGLK